MIIITNMYEDDDEEYSAPVGTAFAPLEADEIVSRKPEIDQTVRDERGRRRFHGAFTGGFSAGYWNTVGSAEGFTPQIFSSSRVNKADRQTGAKGARPEDFMDDEDFGSFGIAPKRIHTKEDFAENSSFAGKCFALELVNSQILTGYNLLSGLRDTSLTFDDVIKSVFAPSKQSIGMRLFQKMKRHVKMEQKARQRDLFLLQQDDRQSSSSRSSSSKSTTKETLQYETKGDLHGLGYNGALDPDNFLYGDPTKALAKPEAVSATLGGGRRIKISGEAFGYGALEEEDDYMMGASVYGTDDMSQYDFALGGPAPKEKDRRKRRAGPYGTLSGNSLQLEGFEKAAQRSSLFAEMRRHYRPPEVPNNWRPKKRRKKRAEGEEPKKSRWGAKVGEQTQPLTTTIESVGESGKTSQQPTLNANLRAVILGEEVVHRMGVAKPKMPPPPPPPPPQSKPLENQQQQQHSTTTTTASFPQKPLSGFFASRFTRGSSALDDPTISAGLSTFKDLSSTPGFEAGGQRKGDNEEEEAAEEKPPTRSTYQWHPHKLVCRRFGLQHPFPQFPDVVGIVSVDRGGQKTRNMTSTLQNVKQANQLGSSSTRTLFAGLFGNMEGLASFSPAVVTADSAAEGAKNKPSSMPPPLPPPKSTQSKSTVIEVESDDEEKEETEKQPRPPIDLFKSIFASDEEDDSDEEKEEASAKPKADSAAKSAAATEKYSSTAEASEAASNGVEKRRLGGGGGGSGIFAGVDFAQLSQNFNPCLFNPCLKPQAPEPNTSLPTAAASELDDDCYGPALPPPPPPPSSSTSSKPTTVNSHLNINHNSAGKSSSSSSTLKASSSSSHHRSSSHRSGDRDKESSSSSRSRRHKESSKKKSKKKKSKKKSASSSSAKSSSKHHKSSSSSGSRDRKRKNNNSSSDDDDSSSRDDDDSDSEAGSNSPESKRHRKSGSDPHSIDTQILELIKAGRRQH